MHLALLHHLKGVGLRSHRMKQAATSCPTFLPPQARMAWNPAEINENPMKSMKIGSLTSIGNRQQMIGNARHRFCHQSGPHSRSIRNSTTRLHGFALRVFLAALKHGRKLRLVSKCNTNESKTSNKIAKSHKFKNQAKQIDF